MFKTIYATRDTKDSTRPNPNAYVIPYVATSLGVKIVFSTLAVLTILIVKAYR